MQCIFLPGYEFVFYACRFVQKLALAETVSYLFYKNTTAVCYLFALSNLASILQKEMLIHYDISKNGNQILS